VTELPNGHDLDVDPRVILAAERTLLAWIRTGVAMMGFGFVLARFGWFLREMAAMGGASAVAPQPGLSHLAGVVLVLLAIAVNAMAAGWYVRFVARYRRGEPVAHDRLSLAVLLAVAIAVMGIALTWYLLRLT
jgi:putative membrane protein